MKEKLMRFMQGRYGADAFSKCLLVLVVISMLLSMIFRKDIFNWLTILLLLYSYFRMFSKNHSKRYAENQKYLSVYHSVMQVFHAGKKSRERSKTHHIYKCPKCGQKVRIPRGKGTIMVKCPKCNTEFMKKS